MEQKDVPPLFSDATQGYCVSLNFEKTPGCSDRKWRRNQVIRFLAQYTQFRSKPSKVLEWIMSHEPNPWADCNRNKLGKLMKRLNTTIPLEPDNARGRYNMVHNIAKWDELPVFPLWNYSIPVSVSVNEWRRTQLLRYLKHHPETKPKEIIR